MKNHLKKSSDSFGEVVKKYAQIYREKIENQVDAELKKNEASTTGTMGVATGGAHMGGDIGTTPFAFNRKGARPSVVHQAGFTPTKKVKKSQNYKLENQMYSEPAYVTPAQNIEPVSTYRDQNGLVQHGDPELDPGLAGHEQGQLPMTEQAIKLVKKIRKEGVGGLIYKLQHEVEGQPVAEPATAASTAQPNPVATKPKTSNVDINVQSYNVQTDFTDFDSKLKDSTEQLKTNLQRKIQDAILDKKIVVRASKGYKQPEADYTINVTGVNIDYYYDRYVIVITGREESKQKVAKFFIKPGFKIRILGKADVKPKDQYQIAKSKALVDPNKQVVTQPSNVVTSDEPAVAKQTAGEKPPGTQPTA